MTDSSILYMGIVCFSLIFAALVITVLEFRKIEPTRTKGKQEPKIVYRT
jgi:hypothetical protein